MPYWRALLAWGERPAQTEQCLQTNKKSKWAKHILTPTPPNQVVLLYTCGIALCLLAFKTCPPI